MRWTPRAKLTAGATAVALAGGLTAGLALGSGAPRPGPPVRLEPKPTVIAPTPTYTGPLLSPFTGERIHSLGPVLAVKIDNIVLARPQTGLNSADIVYVLPVEGGLSRFMAIFSSHFPRVIGPVRSSREDDLMLLRQFGRPAFAYSGAQPNLLRLVEHARTVDLYANRVGGYYRDYNRIAPYNLFARTRELLAEAKGASKAHDIGFRFGPAPPGGRPVSSESAFEPAASFTFRWSKATRRWLVWMDGAPAQTTDAGQMSATTVVIQHTRVRTSGYLEWGRQRPPYAVTMGSGTAVVLRDGRAYQTHWSRPTANGGTTFTTDSGRPMTFAPGRVWVVFVAG
ncbi:MAG TPA: DUF3048 domain-containing protein [Streptosporangiaceae bacterium]|nr:DUF3048 domain-containing protein [Streptosporangiaceae bacterium]